jgi:hypothetical protein
MKRLGAYSAILFFCFAAAAGAPARAQQGELYEPLVNEDARGFKPAKYEKDLAFCRSRAAPHAAAAAAHGQAAADGAGQVAAGTALSAAGGIASVLPIPGFTAARNVFAGGVAADAVGGAVAAGGAAKQAEAGAAAEDALDRYQLVVDNCLIRRGYKLLR